MTTIGKLNVDGLFHVIIKTYILINQNQEVQQNQLLDFKYKY